MFIAAYVLIFLLCMVGNTLVCFIVLKNRHMRTVTNMFILNLAVSDLLVGIFCMPTTLVDNLITGKYDRGVAGRPSPFPSTLWLKAEAGKLGRRGSRSWPLGQRAMSQTLAELWMRDQPRNNRSNRLIIFFVPNMMLHMVCALS